MEVTVSKEEDEDEASMGPAHGLLLHSLTQNASNGSSPLTFFPKGDEPPASESTNEDKHCYQHITNLV
jgi:hypothetical protein